MIPISGSWKCLLSVLFIVIAHLSGAEADLSAFIQQEVHVARGAAKPLGFQIQWPPTEPSGAPAGESSPPEPGEATPSEPTESSPPELESPPSEPIPLRPHTEMELDGGGQPWKLFDGNAPRLSKNHLKRDEAFVPADVNDPVGKRCCPGDVEGNWYYNVSVPVIVPFLVDASDSKRTDAAILVIPGGGMRFLAWQKEGTHVAKWLNSIGINAFVLKYRIPANTESENIESVVDVQRSLSLLRYHADTLGLNSSRIGVMGFSAGGILAARASTAKKSGYTRFDDISKMPHLPDFAILIYAFGNPLTAASAPPTFMAIAIDDQCVPVKIAEAYYVALEAAKNPGHELHVFAEGRHGYGDCSMYVEDMQWKSVCQWTELVKAYLQSQVFNIHQPITPT